MDIEHSGSIKKGSLKRSSQRDMEANRRRKNYKKLVRQRKFLAQTQRHIEKVGDDS